MPSSKVLLARARSAASGSVTWATGAASGAAHGAIHTGEPGSVYMNFVQRCLRDKGYDVIGWK
jgi:hypothetical protein